MHLHLVNPSATFYTANPLYNSYSLILLAPRGEITLTSPPAKAGPWFAKDNAKYVTLAEVVPVSLQNIGSTLDSLLALKVTSDLSTRLN